MLSYYLDLGLNFSDRNLKGRGEPFKVPKGRIIREIIDRTVGLYYISKKWNL